MNRRKGFTLIELMVVVLIVAVLAAVLVPLMRSRIEAAKWSEGKAGAGTVATAIRAYAAEVGQYGQYDNTLKAVLFPVVSRSDLDGKYFKYENYVLSDVSYTQTADPPLTYTVTVNPPLDFKDQTPRTLDHLGLWDYETP